MKIKKKEIILNVNEKGFLFSAYNVLDKIAQAQQDECDENPHNCSFYSDEIWGAMEIIDNILKLQQGKLNKEN